MGCMVEEKRVEPNCAVKFNANSIHRRHRVHRHKESSHTVQQTRVFIVMDRPHDLPGSCLFLVLRLQTQNV